MAVLPTDRDLTKKGWAGLGAGQEQIAAAVVTAAVWVGGCAGSLMLVLALVTRQAEVAVVGASTVAVGAVALVQRNRPRPQPLWPLGLASFNCLALAPFTDRVAHATILPTLTLIAFVGVLAMPKWISRWYCIWCAGVGAVSLLWILPGLSAAELVAGTVMLGAVALGGWHFLGLAGDLMAREEASHGFLFHASPVALLEEDFTAVQSRLEEIRQSGVDDLASYLAARPEALREMISTIEVRRANRAALEMIGVDSVALLNSGHRKARRSDRDLDVFLHQILAVWEGRDSIVVDLDGFTFSGKHLQAVLYWSVPRQGTRRDLSRVMVAMSDITPRVEMEQRLARALDVNRSLLEFEHALARCSQSLLLGSGEAALEEALTTLREAMGADRAYLTVNVDDPEQGMSFHVVRSVSLPQFAEDEWMGRVIPWSKYPMVSGEHAAGRPFQHIGTEHSLGWSRSILTVPVFTEGRWAGSVGFMDMERSEPWSDEAVRMLEVAAPMLGTFWEREVTRQRLEDLVMSKDRFLASVSHELRTPLAAVLGFAEELRTNSSSFQADELTDMLELIADQSQEMADMVEDLLVSARADIGTVSIRAQDVYLRAQAEAVLAGLGTIDGKDIQVVGGKGLVWADPSRTRQIIRNLITNAVRYGGDSVVIEAVEGEDETVLTVTDDGPGLDRSQWEEIFEPYQRAHDAPTQPASIGLGLTVSRQLARLMGGELVYWCDEERSVFSLTLPARSGQLEDEEADGERARLAAAAVGD